MKMTAKQRRKAQASRLRSGMLLRAASHLGILAKHRDSGKLVPMLCSALHFEPVVGSVKIKDQVFEWIKINRPELFVKTSRKDGVRPAPVPRIGPAKAAPEQKQPSTALKQEFYSSWEWQTIRMRVLKERGRACECCGATAGRKTLGGETTRICVDHIKPISKFWELRLSFENLQVLCHECNMGKGNWDYTDWRSGTVAAGCPENPDN